MVKDTGARLGILMLDTRFPRILGDVGNAGSWPFPVRYAVVPGATPEAIVCDDIEPFVEAFIAAGRRWLRKAAPASPPLAGSWH